MAENQNVSVQMTQKPDVDGKKIYQFNLTSDTKVRIVYDEAEDQSTLRLIIGLAGAKVPPDSRPPGGKFFGTFTFEETDGLRGKLQLDNTIAMTNFVAGQATGSETPPGKLELIIEYPLKEFTIKAADEPVSPYE